MNAIRSSACACVALLFGLLGACGGGSSGPGSIPAGPFVDAFSPSTLASEVPTPFAITGAGFGTSGTDLTLRLEAAQGTPFLGGTAATFTMNGTVQSDTRITGTTTRAGVSGSAEVRVVVVLTGGTELTSQDTLGTVEGPTLTDVAPSPVLSILPTAIVVTGTGFGGSATVQFETQMGQPFGGGASQTLDLDLVVESDTRMRTTTPDWAAIADTDASAKVVFSTGAEAVLGSTVAFRRYERLVGDVRSGASFGRALALDGDTLVVSEYDSPVWDVHVYVHSASGWELQQTLPTGDAATGDEFGFAVAVSGDRIAVGAPQHDTSEADAGAVYVYARTNQTWALEQKLTSPVAQNTEAFGRAVGISGDSIVVGAPFSSTVQTFAGAAYLYERVGGVWTKVADALAPGIQTYEEYGFAVAIDGDVALVGSHFAETTPDFYTGSAFVFERSAGVWSFAQELDTTGVQDAADFGGAVSVDGDLVVVGARYQGGRGAAYVYRHDGTDWDDRSDLVAPDGEQGDAFGEAVSVSGSRVLAGAPTADDQGLDSGSAYLFTYDGSSWDGGFELTIADSDADDRVGAAVSVSGAAAVVGAPRAETGGVNGGAIYVH